MAPAARIMVIGGGLTGLVAAERLSAAGTEAVVVERESEPGGACRSIECDGYTFDHTGHLLHIARPETEDYLRGLGIWELLTVHDRRAAVVIGEHTTPYPIQIHTHRLAPGVRRDCLLGFIRAWADAAPREPENFREWVLQRFGDGFAEHFFFPYNSKLYRALPEELSLDWVGRYVPKPDLEEVVDGALGLHDAEVGYNARFRYPTSGGIRLIPDAVADRVEGLRLGTRVVAVHLGERWLETESGDRLHFNQLVSTVSLPAMIDLIVDELSDEVESARKSLRWVRVLNLALGVEGDAPAADHWLYYPAEELPFYRVGFPSNHGRLAPEGCHTVSVEVSLDPEGSELDRLAADAENALEERGLLDSGRIQVRRLTVMDPAYVVFDLARREAVSVLRHHLRSQGVRVAGRWAEWKYSAMEDAILDGMSVARRITKEVEG
jgi:protoporphyrinogen oxidase